MQPNHVFLLVMISFLVGLLTILVGTHIYERKNLQLEDGLYLPTVFAKDGDDKPIDATFEVDYSPWERNGCTVSFGSTFRFKPKPGTLQTPITEFYISYPIPVAEGFETWVNGTMLMVDEDGFPVQLLDLEIRSETPTVFEIVTYMIPPSQYYSSLYEISFSVTYRCCGVNIQHPVEEDPF